ncbi:hypothetical protein F511_43035 [Dorcoceras hygrometricum]|uniref:Dystroglycan-like n=1 Tax=Dorcoceras hygrometricum TaxID=472368 RepID=A0A2Z7B424_9LAMI|nr:hypothetical protein F511_43035 [Dorcoceras hygrometricum]
MAASFYSNAIHVDFDSVLAMDEPRMVSMFQALVASGLQGFLGCSAVVYEEALVEFFANGHVRDGLVVSSVDGVTVEISEELFAETFELHVDGLGDLSEMPKDVIFDARSIVSLSGEPISLSGRKNQMKFEFRLLCDIVAKAIYVKAGSFNAITVEKFSLMTAVVCRIKMNWAKFLFIFLKKMVRGPSKPKGLAQENHNVIHAQLSELVDYIHRGSADKKGESGSRGLQKPANTQKEGSAVTPSFEQIVQMAQRRIVQTVLDADANRESVAAERDRERRRKEAKSLKRRRKDYIFFSAVYLLIILVHILCAIFVG